MVTREELRGKWSEVKGRIQEQWAQLTDEDLRRFEGGTDRLIGVIQQKTGATRREIENFLDQVVHGSGRVSAMTREYADQAREYADHAAEAVRDGYRRASDSTRDTVSSRPLESILLAGFVGLVIGALLTMSRRR